MSTTTTTRFHRIRNPNPNFVQTADAVVIDGPGMDIRPVFDAVDPGAAQAWDGVPLDAVALATRYTETDGVLTWVRVTVTGRAPRAVREYRGALRGLRCRIDFLGDAGELGSVGGFLIRGEA